MTPFVESIGTIIGSTVYILSSYFPKMIAGFLVVFIGLIVASLLKDFVKILFKYFRVEKWLETAGIVRGDNVNIWPKIFSELIRWTTIFIFLISAIEIWGIPKVGEVLGQLLNFLPNVFIAVVIGWVGIIAGRLAFDIVRHGVRGVGGNESIILGNVAKYSILFFTILIILTQLRVAAELVKILFTGLVAMIALAFGLSFGLGGQDEARDILKVMRQKFSEKPKKSSKNSR